jgi:uncharacterized membrane-anchored protein
MNSKILIALAFLLVAAAQIYIPASMIGERETIIANGKRFKFETMPVDPADLMRGRYINLFFLENNVVLVGDSSYISGQDAYIVLEKDADGYAKIHQLTKDKPVKMTDYLKVEIDYIYFKKDTSTVFIEYPFDRYYMEEYKAPKAEELYSESLLDTSSTAYAVVMIKDGEGVLTDVMINERPIKELVDELTK